jgi:hypothetical protein
MSRNLNGARTQKLAQPGNAVLVALPKELWRAAGECQCPHCKGALAYWDTLAVPTDGGPCWTVHNPGLQK